MVYRFCTTGSALGGRGQHVYLTFPFPLPAPCLACGCMQAAQIMLRCAHKRARRRSAALVTATEAGREGKRPRVPQCMSRPSFSLPLSVCCLFLNGSCFFYLSAVSVRRISVRRIQVDRQAISRSLSLPPSRLSGGGYGAPPCRLRIWQFWRMPQCRKAISLLCRMAAGKRQVAYGGCPIPTSCHAS